MTGQTVTVWESRSKLLLYAILSVTMTWFFSWFAYDLCRQPDNDGFGRLFVTGIAGLCWVGSAEFVRRLIWPTKLVLDHDGFWFRHWTSKQVLWSDVETIKLTCSRFDFWSRTTSYHDEPPGQAYVAWTLKPAARAGLVQQANVVVSGAAGVIPKSMTISATELAPIMMQWWRLHSSPTDQV